MKEAIKTRRSRNHSIDYAPRYSSLQGASEYAEQLEHVEHVEHVEQLEHLEQLTQKDQPAQQESSTYAPPTRTSVSHNHQPYWENEHYSTEMAEKSDKTIHFYNRFAPYYDRGYRSYLRHTHDKFMEMLGDTHPEDRILDLSGGTGMLAERLIQEQRPFAHLTVNDPSLGMLNSAMKKLPTRMDLTYTHHKAEELPFADGSFDVICSLNSFHYYTDQAAVLQQAWHLLSPGGRLLLLDWNLEGFFYVPNFVIKSLSPEYIDTKHVGYHEEVLPEIGFSVKRSETWRWRYWNFYRLEARKTLG